MNKELRQEDLNAREEVANVYPERFWNKYLPAPTQANPNGMKSVEMVMIAKKGTHITIGQRTPMRITQARKDRSIWLAIERYYDAWKKGQDAPVDGTPLDAWPGLTPEEGERLKLLQVRSVEDIAGMNDADIDRYGMGGLALRQRARAFTESKKGVAVFKAELDQRDKQLASMAEQITALTAQIAAKPKRGRPSKQAEAA